MSIKVVVQCWECSTSNPFKNVMEKSQCLGCGATLDGEQIWHDLVLGYDNLVQLMNFKEQEKRQASIMGAYNCEIEYGRLFPACEKCNTSFTPEQLEDAASENRSEVVCAKCSEPMGFQKAPQWLIAERPALQYIVGEIKTKEKSKPAPVSVMFACMSCGGNLRLNGKDRLVQCDYCSSSNYLPDDLWFRLHPKPTRHRLYFVIDTECRDSNYLTHLYNEDSDYAIKMAKKKDLSNEELEALAVNEDYEVRALLAKHQQLPGVLVSRLAADEDDDVRIAVAKRGDLPYEDAKKLACDSDYEVREALARNSLVSWEIKSALSKDNDSDVQLAMAGAACLPEEIGIRLAQTRDSDILKALVKNSSASARVLENISEPLSPDSDFDRSMIKKVVIHPNCTEALLHRFYCIKELRSKIKAHKNFTEPSIFTKLFS